MDNNEDKVIKIPAKYHEQFSNVLDALEKETGLLYQITIAQHNTYIDNNLILGEFSKRNIKIMVYDMDDEYKELEGIYDNIDNVKEKIKELGQQTQNSIHKMIFGAQESKWSDLNVSDNSFSIWVSGGRCAGYTIMDGKGKYKFI